MGLHPLFQDIMASHIGVHDRVEGLRPVGEPLGRAMADLDRVVAKKAGKSVIQNLADVGGWEAPEEGTERYRMLEAALASRGMPYRFRGGDGCHDAWSLLLACAEFATERDCMDLIRSVPGFGGVSEDGARMALAQWGLVEVKVRHAEPGDVLLFAMPARGGLPGGIHAAILSAPGGELSWAMKPGKTTPEARIIHAYSARATVEAWAGPHWSDNLIAAFSFDAPGGPVRAKLAVAA